MVAASGRELCQQVILKLRGLTMQNVFRLSTDKEPDHLRAATFCDDRGHHPRSMELLQKLHHETIPDPI